MTNLADFFKYLKTCGKKGDSLPLLQINSTREWKSNNIKFIKYTDIVSVIRSSLASWFYEVFTFIFSQNK